MQRIDVFISGKLESVAATVFKNKCYEHVWVTLYFPLDTFNSSKAFYVNVCDPMDYTVHGILQAGILEWVAFPFSRGSSQPRDRTHVSHIAGRFFIS